MEEIARVFGINWKLLIIQAVNFSVLLVVLWYFLYRPILKMLDVRRAKVSQGVADAQRAQTRLEEVEQERQEVLAKASKSAEEVLTNSKERAAQLTKELIAEASSRADAIVTDSKQRADEVKEQARRESEEEIGRAAILAAEKILREKQS